MRGNSPPSMLRWISTMYKMTPAQLARMFHRNARTVSVWLKEGGISERGGKQIRSAFSYLDNLPNPHDPRGSGADML